MTSPAGPCEWCGGPQKWTIIGGDMYVSCDGGCSPLPGLGLDPPPDSPELRRPERTPKMEHVGTILRRVGIGTPEGGAANESVEEDYELPF